jgi:hypothetical protein
MVYLKRRTQFNQDKAWNPSTSPQPRVLSAKSQTPNTNSAKSLFVSAAVASHSTHKSPSHPISTATILTQRTLSRKLRTSIGIKLMRVRRLTAMPRPAKSKGAAAGASTETICAPKPKTIIEKKDTRPKIPKRITRTTVRSVDDVDDMVLDGSEREKCQALLQGREDGKE